jgi:thioesterase domain-containing protein/acyl carrier protein
MKDGTWTRTEIAVASLFEEMIDNGPIGRGDDFFDRGGDSLMAVRMLAEIKRRLSFDLPLSSLLGGATVERIAAAVGQDEPISRLPLIQFRPGRSGSPLIFLHSAGGSVLSYLDLARRLPTGRAVYGLEEPKHLGDGALSIEARAAIYSEILHNALPEGPWLLAGHSFGGLLAFEIARQSGAAGRPAEVVILLDTMAPMIDGERDDDGFVAPLTRILGMSPLDDTVIDPNESAMWSALAAFAKERMKDLAPYSGRRTGRGGLGVIERFCRSHRFVPGDEAFGYPELRCFLRSMRAAFRSAETYAPGPYMGRVALVQASESIDGAPAVEWNRRQAERWGRIVRGELLREPVAGHHLDLLGAAHAEELAGRISRIIGKSSPRSSG